MQQLIAAIACDPDSFRFIELSNVLSPWLYRNYQNFTISQNQTKKTIFHVNFIFSKLLGFKSNFPPFTQLDSSIGATQGDVVDRNFSPVVSFIDEVYRHFSHHHSFLRCYILRFNLEERRRILLPVVVNFPALE